MSWWLLAACLVDPTAPSALAPATPPPPSLTIVDVDPLVRGTPVRVTVRYEGLAPGATLWLVANDGTRGTGPCLGGSLCVDLVAPVEASAPRRLGAARGRATLEVTLPVSPRLGLQLVATDGVNQLKSGVFARRSLADADRDGDDLSDQDELALGTDLWEPDTDADGFTDGDEVAFASDPLDPLVVPVERCDAAGDEDVDGLWDCRDPDCVGVSPCIELCASGRDEDLDGLRDCADPDCQGTSPCIELCASGRDEDLDGLRDCADPDCQGTSPCVEACAGGRDEDLDGLIDCADPECAGGAPCVEVCAGGVDEDLDGLADCEDDECFASTSCVELDCADGQDNDDDGRADCVDDDCWGAACQRKALQIASGSVEITNDQVYRPPTYSCTTWSGSTICDMATPGFIGVEQRTRLLAASGRLATYNEDDVLIGSCDWTVASATHSVTEGQYIGYGYPALFLGFTYVDAAAPPVVFGPGCAAPERLDVFPPTVEGTPAGELTWQPAWTTMIEGAIYGRISRTPVLPWALGDHTRSQLGAPDTGITYDTWSNLRTVTPIERHFAP
jgi:hypothetical protein